MSEIEKMRVHNAMEVLRNIPPRLAPAVLTFMFSQDKEGFMLPVARVLAKYGVTNQDMLPCLMDLLDAITLSNTPASDEGQKG